MFLHIMIAITVGAIFFLSPGISGNVENELASLMAGISGTLFGFVLAALSILVAVSDKALISAMKDQGYFKILLDSLCKSAAFLFLTLVVSIANVVVNHDYITLAVVIFFTLSLSSLVVAGWQFFQTIKHL